MSSLKHKTISNIIWSFIQNIGSRGIGLIATIILARILTPDDFGLIGMLTIFISISQTLMQAGFSQALIHKKNTDEEDYSSVFYINLGLGILLYIILFFSAPFIAQFYDQPILTNLTRVLAVLFVINSFSYVQEAKFMKEMQFKKLMLIHLPSTLLSAIIAVAMAMNGFGVWSIAGQQISMRLGYAIQIWFYAKWTPLWKFNFSKVKGLFNYGGKLMLTGLIIAIYNNIYYVIIGKFFPIATLGYYQYSKKLVDIPATTISTAIKNVSFSAFSKIQDDNIRLREGYRKIIQQILFLLCPLLLFSAALANPIFRIILTEKWLPAVPFFQALCIVGIFYPINTFNLDIVNIKGRSDLFLKLEVVKKVITTIGIFATIPFGIWPLIIFQVLNVVLEFFINSYFSGKFINYTTLAQIKEFLPILCLSAAIAFGLFLLNKYTYFTDSITIIGGALLALSIYLGSAIILRLRVYADLKEIIQSKINLKLKK